ncbi:MAG: nucleotidyltransferase family protein [Bacteroidaceae bacterium]|nr:nucleotidyltransferase family protein [Bacteroidaceae bacterium]
MHDIKGSSHNADTVNLFFSLIRCGIGKETALPSTPTVEQWKELYEIAREQTLQGIAFAGLERLPKEQRPSSEFIINWYKTVVVIKKNNAEMTRKAVWVSNNLLQDGFRSVILKGQAIAQYYPDPSLRVAGDIDVWVEGGCDRVVEYVRSVVPECYPVYHHVDFPVLPDTGIEFHYRPTWMYNPFTNKRLQRFFKEREQHEFVCTVDTSAGTLYVPTLLFNLVYIPIHIYRHLFDEGIGMRQILDYYYVLQQHSTAEERVQCVKVLKSIGMLRFMKALMYVMQQMFALDDERMLVVPDEKQGRFLLNEIMLAGNFGANDSRYTQSERGYNMRHFVNQVKRSFTLFGNYPSETFWNPIFKIWHSWWRARHKKVKAEK